MRDKESTKENSTDKQSKTKKITPEDILNTLGAIYEKTEDGIPYVSPPVEKMAKDYLDKYPTKESAAKAMLNFQIAKCTTSGFITGFGGAITLPVTVPANIASVLYVQMRMISCAAHIGGYDTKSDQVQTFVYACLAGVSVNAVVKKFGVQLGQKLAMQGVKKIPGKVLTKINQKIGFRFITKMGEKGLINVAKMVPVVGAVVGGSLDLVETKVIAKRAYKMFIENDFNTCDDNIFETEILEEVNEDTNTDENLSDYPESTEQKTDTDDETGVSEDNPLEPDESTKTNNYDVAEENGKHEEESPPKIGLGSRIINKAKSTAGTVKEMINKDKKH